MTRILQERKIIVFLQAKITCGNMRIRKRQILIIVLTAVIAFSCRRQPESFAHIDKSVPVKVMSADSLFFERGTCYTGTIESSQSTSLGFRTGGKLLSVSVTAGDYVQSGQVLATVDSLTAYNSHLSALAALRQAQDTYERVLKVRNNGGVTESQWQEVLTRLEQARSLETIAAGELSHCTLRAPFAGVVGATNAIAGQTLLPMQTVLTLINTGCLNVEFGVAEHELANISKGSLIEVEIPATAARYKATVTEKSLVQNSLTRTYDIKARLPQTTGMIPGMSCKIYVFSNSRDIIIPAHCLHTRREGQAVWVVRNNTAHRQLITTSRYAKNGVVVTGGITPQDTIITEGCQNLYEGAKVNIVER